ncbi:ABC transporter ATP-binding protein [Virgisporangium aliadipatigenens]|uniref:ABC transporter ATP-binding protein n=1 Tax=Virgisporangium aliadipatigenens TaxID=741659 RepID=A0A8J4DPC1_9ACTN|nr:ABC transporter ATP-binding protein [Virgisporangium aliadipatigenens]
MAAVRAVGVSKRYPTVTALDDVSVEIDTGRMTAVLGPSGSGKSTLLHCLAGLDTVDSGAVYIGDVNLCGLDERRLTRLRRDRIGFVFQSFNLVPTLTAAENVVLPLRLAGRSPERAWVARVIDAVGLADRLGHRPAELSGGQQQRVAVARALVARPAVVFADEPTGNLDSLAGAGVLALLRRCVDEFGQTVVMVTHDPIAAGHADRALFLRDGRVVDDLPSPGVEQVLERLRAPRAAA